MTFTIAFIDPARGDYTPDTPRLQPLGGSQSALCYLTEKLAAAGLPVTLVNGTRTPGSVRGVRCLSMAGVSLEELCRLDVVVLLNSCARELALRLRAAPGKRTLILWTQHAANEPAIRDLADPDVQACWDGFAFVSLWQMEEYLKVFGIDRGRCGILRNGIAPAFADLFRAEEDILEAKPWPPVLAYSSAPFRGLDVLLDSFPRIRANLPGTRLRVFSSLEGYQVPAGEDPYVPLYRRCRGIDGVEYVGALSQDDLAGELKAATCLAYLNRFAETSCISAMEAMAAGCLMVSSQLGALAETTAGFARLIPVPPEPEEHARRFAEAATAALRPLREDRAVSGRRLRAQVDHATRTMNWTVRAQDWLDWLGELRRVPVRASAPVDGHTMLAEAKPLIRMDRHEDALRIVQQALAADPGRLLADDESRSTIASCMEDAERAALRLLEEGPGPDADPDIGAAGRLFRLLATIASRLGEDGGPSSQAADLAEALATPGGVPPETVERARAALAARAAAILGRRHHRQGRLTEAVEGLRRAVALGIDPDASRLLIAANVARSQTHLLEALGAHLNAGAREGDARIGDSRWQAEARGLIALTEASLRLDHNEEDRRSAFWATLRGYDAWLAYRTILPSLPRAAVPPGGRKVYDCFQFHNELELLEVRLAELHEVVDRFVLVEATYTHAGEPKPLHYADNRARFAAYADKIIHVVVADDPGGFAWQREAHQREAIQRGLEDCAPTDLIIVGDADEILRAPVVERLRRDTDGDAGLVAPHIDIFLYFLDLKAPEPWVSVAAAPWELIRRIGPNRARYLAKQGIGRAVPNAGWHFTWMGGIERFRTKLEAFAHREMIAGIDRDAGVNRERLHRFYATGRFEAGAVPGMWTGLSPVPIDAGHPASIRERLSHFRRMGWITPAPVPTSDALLDAARDHVAAGRPERAEAAFRGAAALDPACIDAFDGLANLMADRQPPDGALGPLRRCVALDPLGSFHLFALARAHLIGRRYEAALEALLELVAREPDDHRVHGNLGVALKNLGRYAEAEAAGRRSLALHPAEPGALSNLGLVLSAQVRPDEAARALRRAVALAPGFPDARLNLALAMAALGKGDVAEACCQAVLDQEPDNALAHLTLATCLLRRGELERGFRGYEWRTRLGDGRVEPRDLPTPLWRGGDPRGRTILLHDEQGLGDGIQFVRYAPMLRRLGARVVVDCNDALVRLFGTLDGVERVVGRSDPTPPHDVHAALMSLPHLLGTTPATIPAEVPYLRAEPELAAAWRKRLATAAARLRVGLVWAGNPDFGHDRQRSAKLAALLPLLEVEGVSFYGLQKGGGRRELDELEGRLPASFTDLGTEIDDFADTAAIIVNLDLVICVDTAVAHLAGALGRPVWTLLRDFGDWRWLDRGTGTPWYPTMRLFRQERPGAWTEAVAEVQKALSRLAAGAAR